MQQNVSYVATLFFGFLSTHPSLQLSVFDSKIDTMTLELAVVLLLLLLFGVGLLVALVLSHYKVLRKVHDLAAALPAEMANNTDALGCGIATVALALEEVQKILQVLNVISENII